MERQSEIDYKIKRLEQYRRNLAHALQRRNALRDTYVPAAISNDIYSARFTIQQLKRDLLIAGVIVADHPDDRWPTGAALICPYPGMRAFKEADAVDFFGREEDISKLVWRLNRQRLIALIGPSGAGKSSLVLAGLIPRLNMSSEEAQSDAEQSIRWVVRILNPSSEPVASLNRALGSDEGTYRQRVEQLLALEGTPTRLLLVIDQFEELFTQPQDKARERAAFCTALNELRATDSCTLLLTVRADFYPDLMQADMWPLISSSRYEVLPLRGKALREAIECPAQEYGVKLEPGLVERLLADAAADTSPGVLPLLQETMRLLWNKMDSEERLLTASSYEALNGIQTALEQVADAAMSELNPAQQSLARRTFLRLVQFGEGRADTRRQQFIEQLRAQSDDPILLDTMLATLINTRLLTTDNRNDKQVIDIAHEALIISWPILRDWIIERGAAEQTRRRLEEKAVEWVRLGRGSGGLLDAVELGDAERWLHSIDSKELGYTDALLGFITTSRAALSGWGILGLTLFFIDITGILGLLGLQATVWQQPLRSMTWFAVIIFAAVMLMLIFVIAWRMPLLRNRALYTIARYRSIHITIGIFSITTLLLWSTFGSNILTTHSHCAALGYRQTPSSKIGLALVKGTIDPYYGNLFETILNEYGLDIQQIAKSDVIICNYLFTYTLEIQPIPNDDITLAGYIAILSSISEKKTKNFNYYNTKDCNIFGEVAQGITIYIIGNIPIDKKIISSNKKLCEPYLLNERAILPNGEYSDKAVFYLLQAISFQNNYSTAYYNLGTLYFRKHQFDLSINYYQRSVALEPDNASFLTSLGIAYYQIHNNDIAIYYYSEALKRDSISIRAYNGLSVAYRDKDQFADAETQLNYAFEQLKKTKYPEKHRYSIILYKNRGILEAKRHDWNRAIDALDTAYQLNHQRDKETILSYDEELIFYLALSFEGQGNVERACSYWRKYALQLESGNRDEHDRRMYAHERLNRCS